MNIEDFKDKHIDKRAFVICNGPSLNKHDLSKLKDEVTFGLGRIYLHEEFIPKYYTTEDWDEIQRNAECINNYEGPDYKFIAKRFASEFVKGDNVVYLKFRRWKFGDKTFKEFNFVNKNIGVFYWGATVTYLGLQLAYYMGCNPIYIIGADHSFGKFTNKKGEGVAQEGDDDFHFTKGYLEKGAKWSYPNTDAMDTSFTFANEYTKKNNVNIYNATIGGHLDIFERKDYESLF